MIAERVKTIQPSATLKISSLAKELAREGKDVVDMSVGEPDFVTPAYIMDAAVKAMKDGKVFYTPPTGIPELLDAIAEKLRKENKIDVDANNIIVTPGAKYAIFLAMMVLIEKGDEVI
ncbi:pyridoxal phosphate-dependent aminotransferase, partial [Archaeoglobales archaeon]